MKFFFGITFATASLIASDGTAIEEVKVGSKIFTESYILGEIAAQSLEENAGLSIRRRLGMGATGILYEALSAGEIDIYPDYSGTIAEAILKDPSLKTTSAIQAALEKKGLTMSESLGFNNTYAFAVPADFANKHGLRSISDLQKVRSEIRAGFSYEFMERADGYRGVMRHYGFAFEPLQVRRMDHNLAFQALQQGIVNLVDVYTTDAKIKKMDLQVLVDDKKFFPDYQAVWVARKTFIESHPDLWKRLRQFENQIDEARMIEMNAAVEIEKKSIEATAASFRRTLNGQAHAEVDRVDGFTRQLWRRTLEHLSLIGASLLFSILIGVPLGILTSRYHRLGQAVIIVSAVVQTIPSLALLCLLIPIFGVGTKPALAALCLYSLLPVVLNTLTGLNSIAQRHTENARAYGLSKSQVLMKIELPIASPTILAGIKTATIVSIGTATLAALVGAGGYGAPILSGLALNDIPTILTGAVPAAVMALIAYGAFELASHWLIPKGLRR